MFVEERSSYRHGLQMVLLFLISFIGLAWLLFLIRHRKKNQEPMCHLPVSVVVELTSPKSLHLMLVNCLSRKEVRVHLIMELI